MIDTRNTIIEFINSENSDKGALLIDGIWGAGKTYFIKNEFDQILEQSNFDSYSYVSLSGVKSINEIFESIFYDKIKLANSIKNSTVGKISTKLLKLGINTISLGKAEDPIKGNLSGLMETSLFDLVTFNNEIIVLDDLERLSDEYEVADLLGNIYTQFLEENVKIIYLGNEKEICSKKYATVKEKFIRLTIPFNQSIETVINSICTNSYSSDKSYSNYLLTKKDFIIKVFLNLGVTNIRSVIFMLDVLSTVYSRIRNEELVVENSIIYMISVLSLEYKEGGLSFSDGKFRVPDYITSLQYPMILDKNGKEEENRQRRNLFFTKNQLYRLNSLISRTDIDCIYEFDHFLLNLLISSQSKIKDDQWGKYRDSVLKQHESEFQKHLSTIRFYLYQSNSEFEKSYYKLLDMSEKGLLSFPEFIYLSIELFRISDLSEYLPFTVDSLKIILINQVENIQNYSFDLLEEKHLKKRIEEINGYSEELATIMTDRLDKEGSIIKDRTKKNYINSLDHNHVTNFDISGAIKKLSPQELEEWVVSGFQNRKFLAAFVNEIDELHSRFYRDDNIESINKTLKQFKELLASNNFEKIDLFWIDKIVMHVDQHLERFKNEEE